MFPELSPTFDNLEEATQESYHLILLRYCYSKCSKSVSQLFHLLHVSFNGGTFFHLHSEILLLQKVLVSLCILFEVLTKCIPCWLWLVIQGDKMELCRTNSQSKSQEGLLLPLLKIGPFLLGCTSSKSFSLINKSPYTFSSK